LITALTFIIVALGISTVSLSVFAATVFWGRSRYMGGDGKMLTNAIMWQLFAEGLLGFGTLVFAVGAHTGHLLDWPIWLQSWFRFIMFSATGFTTFHLWRVIEKLHDHN